MLQHLREMIVKRSGCPFPTKKCGTESKETTEISKTWLMCEAWTWSPEFLLCSLTAVCDWYLSFTFWIIKRMDNLHERCLCPLYFMQWWTISSLRVGPHASYLFKFCSLTNFRLKDNCHCIASSPIHPERNESALKIMYAIIKLARFILIQQMDDNQLKWLIY